MSETQKAKGGIYGSCNRHRGRINDYVFCCSLGTHQEGEDVTSRPTTLDVKTIAVNPQSL